MGEQDRAGCGTIVVELREEGGEHVSGFRLAVMAREEGLVAPVLTGPEKEDLDTGLAAILGDSDHIGLLDPVRIDALVSGHRGNGADAIAQTGSEFEIQLVRGGLHAVLQILTQGIGLAAQEIRRLGNQLVISLGRNKIHARTSAALDLVEHAGAGAAFIDTVGTGAQHEGFLQRVERVIDRTDRGERAEIIAPHLACAAVFEQLRRSVVAADQDIGEALVIAQQDIEARLQSLDQIGFQQQRLGLGLRHHKLHRAGEGDHQGDAIGVAAAIGIIADAVFQIAGLADIQNRPILVEHAVDARL